MNLRPPVLISNLTFCPDLDLHLDVIGGLSPTLQTSDVGT